MEFTPTELPGVYLIDPARHEDPRGFLAPTFDARAFAERGLEARVARAAVSYNHRAGTLRGMHYQAEPHAEVKLVRCTAGAVWDVALDLRPASPTFRRWVAAELTAANRRMLYIPEGCAHGFLSLTDGAEITYQFSVPYVAEAARGVRWDDPAFAIRWPAEVRVISDRDRDYPDFLKSGE